MSFEMKSNLNDKASDEFLKAKQEEALLHLYYQSATAQQLVQQANTEYNLTTSLAQQGK